MKKLFLGSLLLVSVATTLFIACNKSSNQDFNPDFIIEKNKPFTITKENGVSVSVSDVYSKISSFRREISITTGKGKTSLPKIYITFTSSDNDNIYKKM